MYIYDAIFIWLGFYFYLYFNFLEPDRNLIIWFDWIQIAHCMNVSFTTGSGQTEAGRRFRHASFLPDFGFHGERKTTDFT